MYVEMIPTARRVVQDAKRSLYVCRDDSMSREEAGEAAR